jgi:hypothetical protein
VFQLGKLRPYAQILANQPNVFEPNNPAYRKLNLLYPLLSKIECLSLTTVMAESTFKVFHSGKLLLNIMLNLKNCQGRTL